MGGSDCSLCTDPGVSPQGVFMTPLTTLSLFAKILWDLGNAELHWLSQLGDLGIPIPQVAVAKVGALGVWSKPLLTGKTENWQGWGASLLIERHYAGGGLCSEYVFSALPTHFDVGIFSATQCVGVTQFFSRFLSREMDPCEIVYSVNLWEEGESGAPCLATLVNLKHCLSNNGIIASLSWFMWLFHQNFSCFHSVKSKNESVNCSVLSNSLWPQDRSPIGSSVHWILQVRILEWVASSSSRGSSQPKEWTHVSCVSYIGRRPLPLVPPGKLLLYKDVIYINWLVQ